MNNANLKTDVEKILRRDEKPKIDLYPVQNGNEIDYWMSVGDDGYGYSNEKERDEDLKELKSIINNHWKIPEPSKSNKLYGAILGDLAGQPYEFKYKGDFSEFNLHDERSVITDDTIMTLATAYALINNLSFEKAYRVFGQRYDSELFGKKFREWIKEPEGTVYNSWGNGCLMRISPIMYAGLSKSETKELIVESCMNSHSHPKSIIACLGLYNLYDMSDLKELGFRHNYQMPEKFSKFQVEADKTYDFIYQAYWGSKGTAASIEAVVKCGGDTDTNASIIGELMNYTYQDLTEADREYVEYKLDPFLLGILIEFNVMFPN